MPDYPHLIADIGGTNARFALVLDERNQPSAKRSLVCADFPTLADAATVYLSQSNTAQPQAAAIAVATAVTSDQVTLTNHPWSFSVQSLCETLGLAKLTVINDFTALALALPYLHPSDVEQLGEGQPRQNAALALLGPGTGLGVSGLVPSGDGWIPLQSEGGHATLAAVTQREMDIVRYLSQRYEHVSAERLISGPGLVNLYQAIATLENATTEDLSPAQITEQGLAASCPLCTEALVTFCALLGSVAGNLALTLGAHGGVYIGGGIVPKLGDFFTHSQFRQRFIAKGRFRAYLNAIPSYVILTENLALLGLAKGFEQLEQIGGHCCHGS